MEYPLYLDGRRVGVLQAAARGRDTCFRAEGAAPPGLYRVYAEGGGGRLLLGIWEGRAPLRRCFSPALTAPLGKLLCGRAEISPGEADDWRAAAPGDVPPWPAEGGLFRRRGRVLELALPFDPAAPFPLPSLFCLARIRRLRGREWAVFRFTDTGEPLAAEDPREKYER